jgi:imidazole glycerol-phosphate synthase subunit HisH
MIGILDMRMGNLASVANAIEEVGFDPVILEPERVPFDDLTHLVIPGVGHFGAAMRHLDEHQLSPLIRAYAASGRPLLGLCVGMQILAALGTEGGDTPGLGLIPGVVVRIAELDGLRVPHVGWNSLVPARRHPLLDGVKPDRDVYFVHSYALRPDDPDDLIAATEYGEPLAAIVGRGSVVGCQFHPEKSQNGGIQILENFCRWDGRC